MHERGKDQSGKIGIRPEVEQPFHGHVTVRRDGCHELLGLCTDFVARYAHSNGLMITVLEQHDAVLFFATLAADDAAAMAAMVTALQHVEVLAARRTHLCALVGLPFWPPVGLC